MTASVSARFEFRLRADAKRRIEQYDHKGQQRKNNPPVGLVTAVSLPFDVGAHKRAAVKIVDDRGIESLRIVPVP